MNLRAAGRFACIATGVRFNFNSKKKLKWRCLLHSGCLTWAASIPWRHECVMDAMEIAIILNGNKYSAIHFYFHSPPSSSSPPPKAIVCVRAPYSRWTRARENRWCDLMAFFRWDFMKREHHVDSDYAICMAITFVVTQNNTYLNLIRTTGRHGMDGHRRFAMRDRFSWYAN